jgi:hypothetical protein
MDLILHFIFDHVGFIGDSAGIANMTAAKD